MVLSLNKSYGDICLSRLSNLQKEYDVAIGFQEKNPIYFCVDKVKAKRKIGWIHTDYNKLGINPETKKITILIN